MRARALAGLLALALAAPAAALIVDAPNPSRAENAPPTDPGWRNVGARASRTAVYLGDGWVLTAEHVGPGPVRLEGRVFEPVPGSAVVLDAPGRLGVRSDLVLFRVSPEPALPRLELRRRPPVEGMQLLLMGYGQGRGEPLVWNGKPGFHWRPGHVKRWGTNVVAPGAVELDGPGGTSTLCFRTEFRVRGSPYEAHATLGDSGGAVFARGVHGARAWKLAGIMLAVTRPEGQPEHSALYGNFTHAADLSHYYEQIAEVTGRKARATEGKPQASGKQGAGAAESDAAR